MHSYIHFLRITYVEYKLALASEFVYRWRIFTWVLADIVQPIVFATLWAAVVNSRESAVAASYMISYYFMVALVNKLTQDWSFDLVSNSIIDGDFVKYMTRPFNYLAEMFGMSLAVRTLRVAFILPFIGVGYLILRGDLNYDFSQSRGYLFVLAVILGFIINFYLGNLFALTAFYIKQVSGLKALYANVSMILSGQYVPYSILPVSIMFLFELLPFRYILSFPIEIVLNDLSARQVQVGFYFAFGWLVVLIILYKVMFKISLYKYESQGI